MPIKPSAPMTLLLLIYWDSQKPPNVPVVRDMCATKKQEGKVKFESGIKKYTFRAGFQLVKVKKYIYFPNCKHFLSDLSIGLYKKYILSLSRATKDYKFL